MTHTATMAGLHRPPWKTSSGWPGPPGLDRWMEQTRRNGGCADPIHLTGSTKTLDPTTGTVLHHYSTDQEPGGRLLVAGQLPGLSLPFLRLDLRRDTYHLIRAGLVGDTTKGTPDRATTPASSPPSPHPASAPSTTAPPPDAAAAAPHTPKEPPNWAPRSTPRHTPTTPWRSCGTTTPPTCGATSPSTSAGKSRSGPGDP
ncbi:hypothetical protein SANTM175S_09247 [Streptomyces antimycoticus]